jgi:hypothetical protein
LLYYWGLAEKLPFPKEKIGARKIKKCKGNFSARLCSDEQGDVASDGS